MLWTIRCYVTRKLKRITNMGFIITYYNNPLNPTLHATKPEMIFSRKLFLNTLLYIYSIAACLHLIYSRRKNTGT